MNMSYCMFENTQIAMRQLLSKMGDSDNMDDISLSTSEKRAFDNLKDLCEEFLEESKRLEEAESDDDEEEDEDI